MRVLLPLKKKQDDPNSQEQQYVDESSSVEENYAAEEGGDTAEAAGTESVVEATAEPEGTWSQTCDETTAHSPTAVLLSAAAAKLSCLPLPTSPTSSEDSASSGDLKFPAVERTASATEAGLRGLGRKSPFRSPPSTRATAPIVAETAQASKPESNRSEAKRGEEKGEIKCPVASSAPPSAAFPSGSASLSTAVASLQKSSVASLSSSNSIPAAAPSTPVSSVATGTRARKRRSNSPTSALDLKPPSKKVRDTKPPAIDTTKAPHKKETAALTTTPEKNSSKMAGGRGGRKVWSAGSPSYYVETNGGREDVSNSEDSAEVDVRYTYRHENDPSSARGDAPALGAAAPSNVVSASHNQNSSFYDCGRDDEDVRERESNVDRPEATDTDEHQQFAIALKKQGLEIVEQDGDGNCLFRAISLQVYGDASMHGEVRHRCLDFMARDKEHFSQFITDEPFEQYIRRKRQDGVHGNNPEIQAISELFNRPIEVFVPENGASPLNIFHAEYKTQDAPIRLSYHDGNHYNAVIDPLVPTAGLGLGLPGLQPGLADKMQMAKAVAESDRLADQREYERAMEESQNDQLQRAIKESTLSVDHLYQNKALSLSDCDATNFELEQAVLESSLESFRTFEHGRKQSSKASSSNVRRKRQASSSPQNGNVAAAAMKSSVASIPREARQDAGSIPSAASAASASASVASAPAVASRPSYDDHRSSQAAGPMAAENYPQTVQELVMNGFELSRVAKAYELVGDNFDDLLAFLMSNGGP